MDLYHERIAGLDGEVASVDLPGELLVHLSKEFYQQPELFAGYFVRASLVAARAVRPVVSVRAFLRAEAQWPEHPIIRSLWPFVREALDLGYDYLLLAN